MKSLKISLIVSLPLIAVLMTSCSPGCPLGQIKVVDRCLPFDPVRGVCVPICEQRTCGDDGCGGTCGECDSATPYCTNGTCAAECVPNCEGRICGEDGCGGSCGTCDGKCAPNGKVCAPASFTCEARYYADGNVCDCSCGAPDPDCEGAFRPVTGCSSLGASCDASGACSEGIESLWTCPTAAYQDGFTCNCGCGAPDPDCATLPGAKVIGCPRGQSCSVGGTCEYKDCTPNCDGKTCGGNGCGGSCGECTDALPYCSAGACQATCAPRCEGRVCGDDGCGGECGTCASAETCLNGTCAAVEPEQSCQGVCGGEAQSGCSCDASCINTNSCCVDAEALCGCFPKCVNKVCGDDGCSGSCGSCEPGLRCSVSQQCEDDPCTPDPCNGHGACSASGACTCATGYAGSSCSACANGYTGYPNCVLSLCEVDTCNFRGTCDPATGACECDVNYAGSNCEQCSGSGTFPACP